MLGNRPIIEQIRRQATAGLLSHAYLITGEKGMGKKTLARQICLETFCRNRKNGAPCGECPDCKKVLSGNHPDVITVTHEKPQTLAVDEVRDQVCDTVGIRPYFGGRKIYIIPDAEKMNPQGQNALLKTLEEPPEYVTLLLLAEDERAMLDTVKSRCVKMKLQTVEDEEIRQFLLQGGPAGRSGRDGAESIDAVDAQIAVGFARGNPGRALEMALDDGFRSTYRAAVGLCRNAKTMTAAEISKTAQTFKNTQDALLMLELLENWFRDLLCFRMTKRTEDLYFRGELSAIRSQSAGIRPETAENFILEAEEAASRLRANVNREQTLTLLFLKMRDL